MAFSQRLAPHFYDTVQHTLRDAMELAGLDALVSDHPEDVAYLSGFFHHPCERPVIAHLDIDGRLTLLVPELERQHAQEQHSNATLVTYPEFPGLRPPLTFLQEAVKHGFRVGVPDSMSLGRHRALQEAFPSSAMVHSDLIDKARRTKRPEEVALHQEAARITDVMLRSGIELVAQTVKQGGTLPSEAELAAQVASMGQDVMYKEHSDVVVTSFLAGGLVYSGANSAKPHGLPSAHRLCRGEPFMLSLGCAVGGRYVEGERTFILGEPTKDQVHYYETIRDAQQHGVDTLRPGITCAEANRLCLDVIRDAGLGTYIAHRQGHGIGLGMHEPPWLEDGDDTVIEPGFVLSNEPGVYIPSHGGYRVSDSMIITPDGARPLTSYPKDLDSIVIAA